MGTLHYTPGEARRVRYHHEQGRRLMISRNAVRMLGCGLLCLAGLFAFQKPFRQYPGREYGDFPLPPDWREPGEWAFARLMYPGAAFGYGRRGGGGPGGRGPGAARGG